MLGKKYLKTFFRDVTTFGGLTFYVFIVGVFLIRGELEESYQLIAGLVVIYVVAILIRTFYFKYRPSLQKFENFVQRLDASAFPSVHAARATMLAFVLGRFVQDEVLMMVFALVALGTAASRVYLKEHDMVDVIGGVVLGLVVAVLLLQVL